MTSQDVQKIYRRLKENGRVREHPRFGSALSDTTINRLHAIFHQAMEDALHAHIIAKNPTAVSYTHLDVYKRQFLFLGANIDAAKEAARFGIGADRSVNYKCDEAGTALNYEVISEAVCSVRAARPLSADWKRRIDEDVQRRGR